jgi:streptogramin lyase
VGDPPNASDRAPLRRVETDASGANLIATQDAVILGRRSYDEWAEFWPGSEIQPFASFINARSQVRLSAFGSASVSMLRSDVHTVGLFPSTAST